MWDPARFISTAPPRPTAPVTPNGIAFAVQIPEKDMVVVPDATPDMVFSLDAVDGPRNTGPDLRTEVRLNTAAPDLPRQIAQHLADTPPDQAAQGIELRLSPEELGPLRLTLRNLDGHMTVTVAVERPETLDLMRRHADQLLQDMRSLGYVSVRLDMQAQGDRRPPPFAPPTDGRVAQVVPVPDPTASVAPSQPLTSGGLDLRF
jgi:hypothetical protein